MRAFFCFSADSQVGCWVLKSGHACVRAQTLLQSRHQNADFRHDESHLRFFYHILIYLFTPFGWSFSSDGGLAELVLPHLTARSETLKTLVDNAGLLSALLHERSVLTAQPDLTNTPSEPSELRTNHSSSWSQNELWSQNATFSNVSLMH